MWGREKPVVRDGERRTGKKSLLEAEDFRGIRRNEVTKVLSVGAETADIPMQDGHN